MNTPHLPGRLGHPELSLATDPRTDPRIVAALAPFGLDQNAGPPPVTADAPLSAKLEFCAAAEPGFAAMFEALCDGMSPVQGVERRTETISGPGGDVTLFIHRPEGAQGALPGVLHLHGGGMTILSASSPVYARWRDGLAAAGLMVVGVEFRNAGGALGPHPFPAGLDDCTAALAWTHAHRAELGIGRLIVSGESGGGNLTLATALRARRENKLEAIDGVYAMCPYISNAWAEKDPSLPSLYENDGFFLDCAMMGTMSSVYDPSGDNADNPLCWPYRAKPEDLAGLPPHVISVNELDPLRDEGLAYFRALRQAGVPAVSRTVNGTCHAGDLMFPRDLPDTALATLQDVASFAKAL
ncbi:MAG: alpha/beta hydrolase fold domain-containing protein [Myxococcota bacterium]